MAKWLHICQTHSSPWDKEDPWTFPAHDGVTCGLAGCDEPAVISRMVSGKKVPSRG